MGQTEPGEPSQMEGELSTKCNGEFWMVSHAGAKTWWLQRTLLGLLSNWNMDHRVDMSCSDLNLFNWITVSWLYKRKPSWGISLAQSEECATQSQGHEFEPPRWGVDIIKKK